MSTVLYRLGAWAFHQPWTVLGVVAALIVPIAATLALSPPTLSSEIRIDGVPAQTVVDHLAEDLPSAAGGQGQIVFTSTDGDRLDDGAPAAAIAAAADRVYGSDHIVDVRAAATGGDGSAPPPGTLVLDGAPVPGVMVSPDGRTALFQFAFDAPIMDVGESTIHSVVDLARDATEAQDIDVLPGSTLQSVPELVGVGEVIGLGVAALVLMAALGSVVAAGLPLATALLGVVLGVGTALALSSILEISSISLVLALMLGLAVGIDYALFIVNRQRRLILDDHLSAAEATARAVATSGTAVVFAGATVVVTLLALAVVGIDLLTLMAAIAAGTVVIAVFLALTVLPALLGVIGERVCSGRARAAATASTDTHPVASAWVGLVTRRPAVTVGAVLLVGFLLALPMTHLRLGMPSGEAYDPGSEQSQAYHAVAAAFGEGVNGPLVVAISADDPLADSTLGGTADRMSRFEHVASTSVAAVSDDGHTAAFVVVPDSGPSDPVTADLVRELRLLDGTHIAGVRIDVGVTGLTAMGVDVSDRMADVLPIYLAVVVGLSLTIIGVVFRSVAVPLTATAGFVLTILATLGFTTLVFQDGWFGGPLGVQGGVPVLSLLPVLVTGVLYGLAMDYQVFLVSAMREARHASPNARGAVHRGFVDAGRVVTAAAVIMTAVFAGFIFNADPMIQQFGLALAFGVAFDALIVRMTLIPALMTILGERAWWLPEPLDRVMPALDVEGGTVRT